MELTVLVKAGSRKGPLVEETHEPTSGIAGGSHQFTVYVPERAVDGKANIAVTRAIAKYFGVAPSRVEILRGHTSRIKRIRIQLEAS